MNPPRDSVLSGVVICPSRGGLPAHAYSLVFDDIVPFVELVIPLRKVEEQGSERQDEGGEEQLVTGHQVRWRMSTVTDSPET